MVVREIRLGSSGLRVLVTRCCLLDGADEYRLDLTDERGTIIHADRAPELEIEPNNKQIRVFVKKTHALLLWWAANAEQALETGNWEDLP